MSWVEWSPNFLCNWKREDGGKESMTPFFLLWSPYDLGIYIQNNLVKMSRSSSLTHLHLRTYVLPKTHENMWRSTANISPPFNSVLSWSYWCYSRMENRRVLCSVNTIGIFWEQPEFHSCITVRPYTAKFWLSHILRDAVITVFASPCNQICSLYSINHSCFYLL